jgi:hypothetical protein
MTFFIKLRKGLDTFESLSVEVKGSKVIDFVINIFWGALISVKYF